MPGKEVEKLNEWMEARLQRRPKDRKTDRWNIHNIHSGARLGIIYWHVAWRQYVFEAFALTIYNRDCLRVIVNFLNQQMEARKNGGH